MPPVGLRVRTPGAVSVAVGEIGGRSAVVVEIEASEHLGALSSIASESLELAARLARAERLPLVVILASSGADLTEGMAALHGWGLAARALADCSGIVPVLMSVTGPAVSGPALLLGLADHVVMTESAYAFVSGPTWSPSSPASRSTTSELGGRAPRTPATPAWRRSSCTTTRRPGRRVGDLLAYLPPHNDAEPPRGRTDDPPDRLTPEAGVLLPPAPTGSYDVRAVIASGGRRGELARAARPLGPEPRHRVRHDRRPARRHASRTSRSPSPAPSTSRRRRRAPVSSPSATPSTCRSSPWSTPRASTPARTSSGGG